MSDAGMSGEIGVGLISKDTGSVLHNFHHASGNFPATLYVVGCRTARNPVPITNSIRSGWWAGAPSLAAAHLEECRIVGYMWFGGSRSAAGKSGGAIGTDSREPPPSRVARRSPLRDRMSGWALILRPRAGTRGGVRQDEEKR